MNNPDFRFKQFVVRQDRCAMKVGTDGVLLGAWVNPGNAGLILDIGTGTGLIALMMAQKSSALIHAIDIDEAAFLQAKENFELSPWPSRLKSISASLQQFALNPVYRYDLIVSNPPYFLDAHPAPSEARNIARHMDKMLSIEELTDGVLKLMSPEGKFCVILPYREGMMFLEYAAGRGLFVSKLTKVKTKVEKQEKRLMMQFELVKKDFVEDELVIQEEDLSFTKEYIEMTSEFYLGLTKR